jgi:hypothetical protein
MTLCTIVFSWTKPFLMHLLNPFPNIMLNLDGRNVGCSSFSFPFSSDSIFNLLLILQALQLLIMERKMWMCSVFVVALVLE